MRFARYLMAPWKTGAHKIYYSLSVSAPQGDRIDNSVNLRYNHTDKNRVTGYFNEIQHFKKSRCLKHLLFMARFMHPFAKNPGYISNLFYSLILYESNLT